MSKETVNRKYARITILLQSYIPLVIIAAIIYRTVALDAWAIIAIFLGKTIIAFGITVFRIRHKHDGKIIKKMEETKAKKRQALKQQITQKQNLLQKLYSIEKVTARTKDRTFLITVNAEIQSRKNILPMVNGLEVPFEIINARTILCHAAKAITAKEKTMVFALGSSRFTAQNPYYMSDKTPDVVAVWQNEGHPKEKEIFLSKEFFPFGFNNMVYDFTFLINDESFGNFYGKFITREGADAVIVIRIGSINKKDCIGKECVLRPTVDISRKIVLPPPCVLSVNYVPVSQVRAGSTV